MLPQFFRSNFKNICLEGCIKQFLSFEAVFDWCLTSDKLVIAICTNLQGGSLPAFNRNFNYANDWFGSVAENAYLVGVIHASFPVPDVIGEWGENTTAMQATI